MNNLCPYMTIVRIKMFTKIHGLNIKDRVSYTIKNYNA